MAETDALIGLTISHYRILERLGGAEPFARRERKK
jgi:hypothetical protein